MHGQKTLMAVIMSFLAVLALSVLIGKAVLGSGPAFKYTPVALTGSVVRTQPDAGLAGSSHGVALGDRLGIGGAPSPSHAEPRLNAAGGSPEKAVLAKPQSASSLSLTPGQTLPDAAGGIGVSQATVSEVASQANWILSGQFPDGALDEAPFPSWTSSVTINPYVANYGAMGLARAAVVTGNMAYAQASWRWLDWYARHEQPGTGFVANATVPNPFIAGDHSTSLGTMDSTDAYAGTFLLAAYDTMTADPSQSELAGLASGITGAVKAIEATQQPNGLTWAKPSYQMAYLMDMAETHAGLLAAASLALILGNHALEATASRDASLMETGVQSLWNPTTQSFDWAATSTAVQLTNWNNLYPDAAEQAWAVGFGLATPSQAHLIMNEITAHAPQWDDPTATAKFKGSSAAQPVGYWPAIGWGFDAVGNMPAAQQGATSIYAAAAVAQDGWPFTCEDSAQLIILLSGGPTLAPTVPTTL